ncbi:hypothetical protein ACNF42_08325 [Cuniculiplasma sp. SKW3]|uniref:hypothetical protein n=1 Tax=Cuniculiplasma sp. SKW3 TaxID=3400170 RepID=UPI003FD1FCA5
MTEFRTKGKGKDKKVYPIQKRKPYGISRTLAYEDVQKLRSQGKRARLIETNKRLDLYAPFISDLPEPTQTAPVIATTKSEVSQDNENIPMQIKNNKDLVVKEEKSRLILDSLGILNDKGGLNIPNKEYRKWFEDGDAIIRVDDGKGELLAIDKSTVAMIRERFFTTLPNGSYVIQKRDDGSISIQPSDGYDTKASRLRIPSLDYGANSAVLVIPSDRLKDFISSVNQYSKKENVFLFKSGEKNNGMDVIAMDPNIRGTNEDVIYHYDGPVPEGIRCSISSEYMASVIDTMLGKSRKKNPRGISDFLIKVKADYPMEIGFTGADNRGEPVGYKAWIAPRME